MRTEDHPLDYGDFEGTIPKGEYGGGTVMLWDQGRWIPEPGKDPRKTIEEGHLHFTLEGERMKGEWVMFRLKAQPGEKAEPWMLKKVNDEYAKPEEGDALVDQCVTSVTTDRTHGRDRRGHRRLALQPRRPERRPREEEGGAAGRRAFQPPQLATLVDAVPTGNDWLHEYKYDGYRLLVATGGGAATAWTRNGKDWSDKFRAIVRAAAKLPAGCLIDGEAVALDEKGKPEFPAAPGDLEGRKDADLAFYAFDLLVDQGEDINKLPNLERKERLAALLKAVSPPILYGDHVIGKGEALFDAICKEGGEGIISKKASAPYRGARTRNWLKIKCIQRQEFVIVGWQDSDKRHGFRSLLPRPARRPQADLCRQGRHRLRRQDDPGLAASGCGRSKVEEPPLEVPRAERAGRTGSSPSWSAEVAFTEFTRDGTLRHPSFIALREDKPAREVVLEKPKNLTRSETKRRARDRGEFRDQDQQPRPRHLSRGRADQGRPRRLLRRRSKP